MKRRSMRCRSRFTAGRRSNGMGVRETTMKDRMARLILPLIGILAVVALWAYMSTTVPDLPSPLKTWQDSKLYITQPLVKRGEMDQGIALLAYQSLIRVAKGFLLGALIAT